MRKTAQDYHRERRGNCAQSVAYAWNSKNPGAQNSEERFSECGGGQAPGGLCGALHVSCVLAGHADAASMKRKFAEKSGGHLTCREIRAAGLLTCNACVGLAAELLDEHVQKIKKCD